MAVGFDVGDDENACFFIGAPRTISARGYSFSPPESSGCRVVGEEQLNQPPALMLAFPSPRRSGNSPVSPRVSSQSCQHFTTSPLALIYSLLTQCALPRREFCLRRPFRKTHSHSMRAGMPNLPVPRTFTKWLPHHVLSRAPSAHTIRSLVPRASHFPSIRSPGLHREPPCSQITPLRESASLCTNPFGPIGEPPTDVPRGRPRGELTAMLAGLGRACVVCEAADGLGATPPGRGIGPGCVVGVPSVAGRRARGHGPAPATPTG